MFRLYQEGAALDSQTTDSQFVRGIVGKYQPHPATSGFHV